MINSEWQDGAATHHLSTGNMEQIGWVIAGGQGLRLQGAGILQLLDSGELGLIVAWIGDGEAWEGNKHRIISAMSQQSHLEVQYWIWSDLS